MINQSTLIKILFLIFLLFTVYGCDLFNLEDEKLFEWSSITGLDEHQIIALEISVNGQIIAGTYLDGIYFQKKGGEWQQSNLIGVEIRDIITLPGGKLVAATFGDGVWKSENEGETWVQLTTGPDNAGRLLDLAVTPTGRILVGVFGSDDLNGESDIYYSDDEGASWTGSGLRDAFAIWSIASDGVENGFQYSGTMQTILRSSDNGETWEIKEIPNDFDGQEWMGITVTKAGTVLAVGDGIIKSTDHGNNWELVYDKFTAFKTIISIGDELYAGGAMGTFNGRGRGVLRSTDDGQTWEVQNSGLSNTEVLSLAYFDNKLYAGTSGGLFVCEF